MEKNAINSHLIPKLRKMPKIKLMQKNSINTEKLKKNCKIQKMPINLEKFKHECFEKT
jgi:hypothetical protein